MSVFSKIKTLFFCLFLNSSFSFVLAVEGAVSEKRKSEIKEVVEAWLDNRYQVKSVKTTPLKNVLEVRIGNELVYVDDTASFLFVDGQMISLKSGENLTEMRKQEIFKINFSDLPLDLAIKKQFGVIKNPNRVIAVFEDPYCSYCRKLRLTLSKMKDLTVYTFLFPILGEKSIKTSETILCSKNPAESWEKLMLDGIKPEKFNNDCSANVEKLLSLGKKYNVEATPTIYLINGTRISGAVSKKILNSALDEIK